VGVERPKERGIMTTDERMEKMEGQLARVRWFNRCLIACIVLSLGVWFISKTFGPETVWAQSSGKVIRANRFIVEDENGNLRAVLEAYKEGASLMMCDENGKPRAALAVFKEGPKMVMLDENGKSRAVQKVDKVGPDLAMCDENGKPRAALMVVNNEPSLALFEENGNLRAMLAVSKDGPGLVMFDENKKPIWSEP